jgi:hypothetical protein
MYSATVSCFLFAEPFLMDVDFVLFLPLFDGIFVLEMSAMLVFLVFT